MSSSSTNAVNPFPPKRDKTSYIHDKTLSDRTTHLMPAIPVRTQSNRSNKSSNNYPQTKNYVSKNPFSMEPTNTTGSSKVSEESLMQDAKLPISPSYPNRQILSADQLLNDHRQRNVVPNQTTRSIDSTRTLDSVKNSTKYPIEGVVRRFSDDFSDFFNDHDIKLAVEDKTSNTPPNTPAKGTGYHIFGRNTIQEVKEQRRPRKNPPTPLARPHGQVMEPSSQTQVNHFEEEEAPTAFSRYLGSRFAENEIPSEVGKENGNEESADVVEDEAECMNVAERFKAWFCEVFCCDYAS
ncbi:unnamed protein product [Acanthoscelides obtectus]|uniref:Uncharacterized protein n=1 Tax=Acanthoscelides obtectus TaxID=200917 RepID=A0A9P0MIC1_ACAOB|nr:unnamed protein product [Acanthoscelides obtectus]CAK1661026.1 hypothetical protein AOBTE_LOCUS22390 [Acanthoscelides obtectus]